MAEESKIPLDAAGSIIWLCGSLLGRTWRPNINVSPFVQPFDDSDKGIIYCFWHNQILPFSFIFRNTQKYAVVSLSRDGRRAAAVAQRWKHGIIGGSSSRGGTAAFRQCIRALKQRKSLVITPDGPRGPKEVAKPGIARIAMSANAPVVPVIAHPHKAWRLHSWDRFIIPFPFTRIDIHIKDPVYPHHFSHKEDAIALFTAEIQKALLP